MWHKANYAPLKSESMQVAIKANQTNTNKKKRQSTSGKLRLKTKSTETMRNVRHKEEWNKSRIYIQTNKQILLRMSVTCACVCNARIQNLYRSIVGQWPQILDTDSVYYLFFYFFFFLVHIEIIPLLVDSNKYLSSTSILRIFSGFVGIIIFFRSLLAQPIRMHFNLWYSLSNITWAIPILFIAFYSNNFPHCERIVTLDDRREMCVYA